MSQYNLSACWHPDSSEHSKAVRNPMRDAQKVPPWRSHTSTYADNCQESANYKLQPRIDGLFQQSLPMKIQRYELVGGTAVPIRPKALTDFRVRGFNADCATVQDPLMQSLSRV